MSQEDMFHEESLITIEMPSSMTAQVTSLDYQNISDSQPNSNDDPSFILPDVLQNAKDAEAYLLPPTSKLIYDKTYEKFKNFLKEKKIQTIDERVLLGYFHMLSKPPHSLVPGSLKSIYSMLKKTFLGFFIRQLKTSTHITKKAQVLTDNEIAKFIYEAPEEVYLPEKVALIVGIHGLCRRKELHQLTIDLIEDHGTYLNFVLDKTKFNKNRDFSLTGEYCNIVRKYLSLRPHDLRERNLFVQYQNGKCRRQVIGIHTIGAFPKKMATFLNLPNPEKYTGHSFRRSGATVAAEAGLDFLSLKKLGGWSSSKTPEGYVEKTDVIRNKISTKITNAIQIKRPASATVTRTLPSIPLVIPQYNPSLPSTSREEILQTTKRPKPNPEPVLEASPPRDDTILRENPQIGNILQSNLPQGIHLHFANCSNFNIFAPQNKENWLEK
ncbi:uncharacterized protein LOC107048471 [Diachasma alloeum]|uniref:uncharacterized protein LOC107048471 n=1 Tax=Diachasma alloeum TaxID=454923 RepID=UPI00073814A9|nr:uncharacterized protein LOC107048471 [Diachasma alloeum]